MHVLPRAKAPAMRQSRHRLSDATVNGYGLIVHTLHLHHTHTRDPHPHIRSMFSKLDPVHTCARALHSRLTHVWWVDFVSRQRLCAAACVRGSKFVQASLSHGCGPRAGQLNICFTHLFNPCTPGRFASRPHRHGAPSPRTRVARARHSAAGHYCLEQCLRAHLGPNDGTDLAGADRRAERCVVFAILVDHGERGAGHGPLVV